MRAEGGAHLFTFAALLTSARAARDVCARAHATGVGSAAALSAAYSLRADGGNGAKASVAEASRRGVGPRETALTDAADAAGAPNGTLFQQARADAADGDAADAAADAADFAALDAVVATFTESVSAIISTEGILPAERASRIYAAFPRCAPPPSLTLSSRTPLSPSSPRCAFMGIERRHVCAHCASRADRDHSGRTCVSDFFNLSQP